MPPYADTVQHIRRFFARQRVADIASIKAALGTSSRTTVFRVLSKIGYQTSYSHAGGYYTLHDIPKFDADGLWSCRGALFSKYQTLRATILYGVDTAPVGHTDRELRVRLGLRVRDTLLDLVQARQIGRTELDGLYLYVSANARRARVQLQARQLMPPALPQPSASLSEPEATIEILLAVIRHPKEDPEGIVSALHLSKLRIASEQVEAVWARYGLGKKKDGWRRSPR